MENSPYNWYNSQPAKDNVGTVGKTPCDARVKGQFFTLCEFDGNHCSPDGKRYCKHYVKSMHRTCCMYNRQEFSDERKPKTYAENPVTLKVCDLIEKEVKDGKDV